MKAPRDFRARNRGDVHPGLVAAGLVAALALAWWFARSDAALPARSPGLAPAARASTPGIETPARPGAPAAAASQGPAKPLYRWTDAAGVVHFTDVPPADRPYVEVDVDPERNVVRTPATPTPEP